ncbi:hypothetical protein CDV36_005304 [Fusarium kuroshium]|uniref:Lysine-specific metallo-endopeptidase domain-containing protein n=1 Tax=Fusarium kuroshium TaxID=2010991 RepID=A0A3M2SC47_9HYPO|nr:hypothetical protein CDV36_005304 [Fusarium kuroshium]
MMLKRLLFFFSLLQAVIGQERRIYIDTVTCLDNGDKFSAVQEAYQSAIIRAGITIEVLRPWAVEGAPINTFDGRIRNVFDLLFGPAHTRSKVVAVYDHLDRLPELKYMNYEMSNSAWVTGRTMNDIEIRCNGEHIKPHKDPREPNVNHRDTITGKNIPDGSLALTLLTPKTTMMAVASLISPPSGRGWDPRAPEIIAWNPWNLAIEVNKDAITINQADVEDAATPRMHRWFQNHIPALFGYSSFTPIDLLDRLESTMLHELTHTTTGRNTDDVELGNSYGWRNCLRIQSTRNADSIALFALAVELIDFYHYDVNAAGELTKFEV